jgi:hypothetical protein
MLPSAKSDDGLATFRLPSNVLIIWLCCWSAESSRLAAGPFELAAVSDPEAGAEPDPVEAASE